MDSVTNSIKDVKGFFKTIAIASDTVITQPPTLKMEHYSLYPS